MDQRNELTDNELRRVVQSQPMPHAPAFLTERVMHLVRREHEKSLRRERVVFLLGVAFALLLMVGAGVGTLVRLAVEPQELRLLEKFIIAALVGALVLYEFHHFLCKRFGLPE